LHRTREVREAHAVFKRAEQQESEQNADYLATPAKNIDAA
jgi:hypothetical protein